ncbi:MAG: type II toxin-antitoxin system death-on-curing family toxin [Candidatus Hinthialibacter sp.]
MTWRSVSKTAVLAIHQEQIAEHGGKPGLRDEGLLESALDRLRNLAAYSDAGVAELATAYAIGLAQNHPFVDGNKRTAFVAPMTFLLLNGFDLNASEKEVVETFLRLAGGDITEKQLASWFSSHIAQIRKEF